MKLVFEKPIQTCARFTDGGAEPYFLHIYTHDDEGITIEMSNDDAREILGCLQASFEQNDID